MRYPSIAVVAMELGAAVLRGIARAYVVTNLFVLEPSHGSDMLCHAIPSIRNSAKIECCC